MPIVLSMLMKTILAAT